MSESFHVYLNLDVVNDSTSDDKPVIFSETRTIPFGKCRRLLLNSSTV